jgi:hypothetical protein
MATIKLTDAEGKDFTLSFNLRSVKQMSDNGFNLQEAVDNPVSGIPKLFAGAFLRYHRTLPQAKIDELWAQVEGKEEFITALVEMFNDPIEKLFSEPEENAKKAKWEVVK